MANGILSRITSAFTNRKQADAIARVSVLENQIQTRSVETQEIKELYYQTIMNQSLWTSFEGIVSTTATPETAITVPAVLACVNRISGSISTAPMSLFKRTSDGNVPVFDDDTFSTFIDNPNELMSWSDFWTAQMRALKLCGFAFADIIYNKYGIPFLYPIDAYKHITYQDEQGRVYYEIFCKSGKLLTRYEGDVFHLRGNTREGINSDDPIASLRTTLIMALSLRSHGVNFFKNYANVGGVITHSGKVMGDALSNLKKSIDEGRASVENNGKMLYLPEGLTYSKQLDSLLNSQFEQLLRLTNEEICRYFGVPPSKIAIPDDANKSNGESQNRDYLQYTIKPLAVQIQRELKRKLLVGRYAKYSFLFDLDELDKADFQARATGYSTLINAGVVSANEVRAKEGMNPRQNGDVYLQPLNMVDSNAPKPELAAPAEPDGDEPTGNNVLPIETKSNGHKVANRLLKV